MNKIFLLILIPFYCFSQKPLDEQEVINKSHIDFNKEHILFTLSGHIEIDGHTFKNDTCKCPIVYESDLSSVQLKNKCTLQQYEARTCDKFGCKIIHLATKNYSINQNIGLSVPAIGTTDERRLTLEYNYPR